MKIEELRMIPEFNVGFDKDNIGISLERLPNIKEVIEKVNEIIRYLNSK